MLATLGGCLALLLGIAVLLLPLLTPELSRPRDAFWGAVVLLLGLVLVTSSERLTGAPMLAVLCGGLLIGRLGGEVGRGRWNQLSAEERSALATPQRWASGGQQLAAAAARLLGIALEALGGLSGWLAARRQPKTSGKRWVRPEADAINPEGDAGESAESADKASQAPAGENGFESGAMNGTDAGAASESAPPDSEASQEGEAAEASASPEELAAPADPAPDPANTEPSAPPQEATGPRALEAKAPRAEAAAPQGQDSPEQLPEEVEVEVLDPPPPQRTVPDFHAIDALLRASGALPPTGEAEPPGSGAGPPLADVELEPEQGANAAALGSPQA